MKIKLLVAAIAIAASAQASASILATNDGSGTNEAFLTAWSDTTQTSYAQDLGINFNELVTNLHNSSYSVSQAVDSTIWTQAFGSSNPTDIKWNIAVSNQYLPDFSNAFTNYGIMGTSAAPTGFVGGGLGTAIDVVRQQAVAQNGANPADGQNHPLTNLAYYGDANNGAFAGSGYWGFNYGNNFVGNNTGALGSSLNWYYYGNDANYASTVEQAAGTWTFDGKSIQYGSAVSAVPVPAAIWLMGSGLIGMVGVARRKKRSV